MGPKVKLIYPLAFIVYLLLHFLTSELILPLQKNLDLLGDFGAVVYLPSAVRVIMIWLYGFIGFWIVLAASVTAAFLETHDVEAVIKTLPLVLGSPLTVLLAFTFSVQWRSRPRDWIFEFQNWKNLISVAALGGGINGLMFSVFYGSNFLTVFTVMVGDVLGLCVGYLVLVSCFRYVRSRSQNQ